MEAHATTNLDFEPGIGTDPDLTQTEPGGKVSNGIGSSAGWYPLLGASSPFPGPRHQSLVVDPVEAGEPGSAQSAAIELGQDLLPLGRWSPNAGPGIGFENGIVGGVSIIAHASRCQVTAAQQGVLGVTLTRLLSIIAHALRSLGTAEPHGVLGVTLDLLRFPRRTLGPSALDQPD